MAIEGSILDWESKQALQRIASNKKFTKVLVIALPAADLILSIGPKGSGRLKNMATHDFTNVTKAARAARGLSDAYIKGIILRQVIRCPSHTTQGRFWRALEKGIIY